MEEYKLIVSEKDHKVLVNLIRDTDTVDPITTKSKMKLKEELKSAIILSLDKMPADVVRINSIVNLATSFGRKSGLQLVLPHLADIQKGKLSVMSPMGTALMGYKKGAEVLWHFPKGDETITIEDVNNQEIINENNIVV